jgi:uncharacterized RDD family membrane protein YckC
MSCPWCGDECRCNPQSVARPAHLRPRFEPENLPTTSSRLVDPDTYDASEEQFAAILEVPAPTRTRPRFVVEADSSTTGGDQLGSTVFANSGDPGSGTQANEDRAVSGEQQSGSVATNESMPVPETSEREARDTGFPEHDPDFWKQQVAARVDSFRARRKPRPPRYPSLTLRFDPPEVRYESSHSSSFANAAPAITHTSAPDYERGSAIVEHPSPAPESARILEFPRSYDGPPPVDYELAEPVLDRPRIVEAPEVEPPRPALGGIIIESEEEEADRRPSFEVPLQSAPMGRRVLAGAVDGIFVMTASGLFAFIFFRIAAVIPPLTQLLSLGLGFTLLFWAAYQYLLLTYAGSTPGLRLARLELRRFDGSPVLRNVRRWRVLTSVLSALSVGLGFAWCFLDEDALCWHDRITRTYLAPK